YHKASKAGKATMLDELVALTGWCRSYASRVLRHEPKKRHGPETRGRTRIYTSEVMLPLRKIWASMDYACGNRVAAGMSDVLDPLVRFNELSCEPRVIVMLKTMSAATIDRILAPDRADTALKGRSTRGEYCNTLDATDIATGWTETRAVRNKAQVHVFAALKDIRKALPFPLLGIDSDNGSEFINAELLRYCTEHDIAFTRSRAYRKNDGRHVEQKNWSVVRQNVGYARFDTPTTPYRRVLVRDDVDDAAKARLTKQFENLDPADLRRRIGKLQDEFYKLNARKNPKWKEEVKASDLEYIYCEATNQSLEYLLSEASRGRRDCVNATIRPTTPTTPFHSCGRCSRSVPGVISVSSVAWTSISPPCSSHASW
ncbi:MAG: transposase family protein, partial [Coriobacteriia bacterium]|nr:transposase family protein [Coriobacteriia bacterium]